MSETENQASKKEAAQAENIEKEEEPLEKVIEPVSQPPNIPGSKLDPITRFALTASYITILPLSKFVKIEGSFSDEQILGGLSKYLPAVGLLIGLILSISSCILNFILGLGGNAPDNSAVKQLLCGVVLTTIWIITTGGLHFDGLMDTADGIFSHRDRRRMLEIMQDSRVGNFGAITGIAAFFLKAAAIAAIAPQALPVVLLLIPAWARLAECYAIGHWSYARSEGKGKIWHDSTAMPRDFILAAILPLITTVIFGILISESAYVTAIFAAFSGLAAGAYLNSRLGGHTGDTYGAVVEACETLTLVALALFGGGFIH